MLVLSRLFLQAPQASFKLACAGAALLAALALVCGAWAWHVHQQAQVAETAGAALAAELLQVQAATAGQVRASAALHPALGLGPEPDSSWVVARMEQAARQTGVFVRRFELTRLPASPQELGRLQIALVAQGDYASLKHWMFEWGSRLPTATVSQLRLERPDSTSLSAPVLEWSGVVTVWSQPMTSQVPR